MVKPEKNKFTENIDKRIWKTIRKQNLINSGDTIMVALSGGKDSMILLETLTELAKRLPFKLEILATHIYITNIGYKTDLNYLQKFCDSLGVKFLSHKFEIDLDENSKKTKCFICSWNRRKALFELCKSYECNKLALGHHMDDAVETLFLNMVYQGSICAMPFSLEMFGGELNVIRPLLEMNEDELKQYAEIREYRKEVKQCPYETTKRQEIKVLIKQLNLLYKNARKNIFRSGDNIFPDYLPHWNK